MLSSLHLLSPNEIKILTETISRGKLETLVAVLEPSGPCRLPVTFPGSVGQEHPPARQNQWVPRHAECSARAPEIWGSAAFVTLRIISV